MSIKYLKFKNSAISKRTDKIRMGGREKREKERERERKRESYLFVMMALLCAPPWARKACFALPIMGSRLGPSGTGSRSLRVEFSGLAFSLLGVDWRNSKFNSSTDLLKTKRKINTSKWYCRKGYDIPPFGSMRHPSL